MRRSLFLAAAAALTLSAAVVAPVAAQSPADAVYAAALADPVRTDADRARDAARHTAETLAFAKVAPGQSIGDMIIGGGYFTRTFSAAVGPEGHVTGWQPAEFVAFAAVYGQALVDIAELPNVTAIDSPLATPAWPMWPPPGRTSAWPTGCTASTRPQSGPRSRRPGSCWTARMVP